MAASTYAVDLLVRGTIWTALVLFVAGDAGRGLARQRQRIVPWALPVFASGALLCAAHFAAVFHWHHGWSHDHAAAATAVQMAEVFGLAWGGGLWFNYLFLSVWIGDALRWARDPAGVLRSPSRAIWLCRGFYAVMIVNATVVFVAWPLRLAGIVLCGGLAWSWWGARHPGALQRAPTTIADPEMDRTPHI